MRRFTSGALVLVVVMGTYSACAADESYRMPNYGEQTPPPPRSRAEAEQLLAGADQTPQLPTPLRVLLVAGPKDHAPGDHDYPAWQKVWSRLLATQVDTEVATAWEFPLPDEAAAADVMVFYQKGDWNEARAKLIDAFLARGGGLVYIHWAVNGGDNQLEFAKRIGLASKAGSIGFRHGEIDIDFSQAGDHPIARNFDRVQWNDETYWRLYGNPSRIHLLGTSDEQAEEESDRIESTPQFWTVTTEPQTSVGDKPLSEGRVFVSIPGHHMWTFDDPAFRLLLMRGIAWAGKRNVDRFNEQIWLDARVK